LGKKFFKPKHSKLTHRVKNPLKASPLVHRYLAMSLAPSRPSPAREGNTWPPSGTQYPPPTSPQRDITRDTKQWIEAVQHGEKTNATWNTAVQLLTKWLDEAQAPDIALQAIEARLAALSTGITGITIGIDGINANIKAATINPPSIPSTGWSTVLSNGLTQSSFATTDTNGTRGSRTS
jgi:hypothetical protein